MSGVKASIGIGVQNAGWRNPPVQDWGKTFPTHLCALTAADQNTLPQPAHAKFEDAQLSRVPGNSVVLARDGLFFRKFAEVHPRYQTPGFAILAQGIWSAVLVVSGSYETLLDYAMFAIWLSYGLMVAGVIVLRYKQPGLARPYRMWGYPVTPALFVAITCWFLANMLKTRPLPSVAGLLLIATGIPVYFLWARHRNQAASTAV